MSVDFLIFDPCSYWCYYWCTTRRGRISKVAHTHGRVMDCIIRCWRFPQDSDWERCCQTVVIPPSHATRINNKNNNNSNKKKKRRLQKDILSTSHFSLFKEVVEDYSSNSGETPLPFDHDPVRTPPGGRCHANESFRSDFQRRWLHWVSWSASIVSCLETREAWEIQKKNKNKNK